MDPTNLTSESDSASGLVAMAALDSPANFVETPPRRLADFAVGPKIGYGGALRVFALLLIAMLATDARGQAPDNPLQQMFEAFAENAGPMAPMFGKLTDDQIRQIEAVEVSTADENRFGKKVLDAYLNQLRDARIAITTRGADIAYLNDLCGAIKPMMKHSRRYSRIDIRVVETESADAYSIPGGHLLITRGLLDTCGNEAALVGVLAHELSHLDRGHQLTSLKHSKLAQQPLDFKDSMMWISLVARPFRPEQETEADQDATEWMMSLDYDAKQLVKLLESWQQMQSQKMPWLQFVPGFVKSHPNPGLRAQAILLLARKLNARFPNASYIGGENLKNRIAKSKQMWP